MASAALVAAAVLLTACSVGPRYRIPSAPVPPAYKELGAPNVEGAWKTAQPRDAAGHGKWWERYSEPPLNELEEKLNISNQNIAAAAANVLAARAMVREARAQYFPTVTVVPGITNSRLSSGFGKLLGITFTNYSVPFDVSWEPDLWGRIRATVNASSATGSGPRRQRAGRYTPAEDRHARQCHHQ